MTRQTDEKIARILPAAGGPGVVAALVTVDSFLLDPFLLFASGFLWAFVWMKLWKPRSLPWKLPVAICVATVLLFWTFSTSLYLNLDWVAWLARGCNAVNGRDWMLNSGVFHFDFQNAGTATHVIAVALLLTYPGWIALGALAGARIGRGKGSLAPAQS